MNVNKNNLLIENYPDLMIEWDYDRNNEAGLDVSIVKSKSNKTAYWLCACYHHSYAMRICDRTRGRGCPYCAGSKALPGFNDLLTLYPEIINNEWDYDGNDANNMHPCDYTIGSKAKALWKCVNHEHSYEMSIKDKIHGHGCPYCAGKKVLVGFNDLKSNYPDIAKEWYQPLNGNITPDMITTGANMITVSGNNGSLTVKPHWKCSECSHLWQATVNSRVNGKSGCPCCLNRKIIPGFNDLQTLYPIIAAEWYQPLNGSITPIMVAPRTNEIIITDKNGKSHKVKPAWKCSSCGHIWYATINSRTMNKTGCPKCWQSFHKSKQEDEVADYIENYLCEHYVNMNYTMHRSISFMEIYENMNIHVNNVINTDGIELSKHLRKELDIYIPELSLAIEYDGDYWHDDEVMLDKRGVSNDDAHMIKQSLCEHTGIRLLIVSEHEWLHDNVNIRNIIASEIENAA